MARSPKTPPGLPSAEQILQFIKSSREPVGKREIARAFALHGSDKIALKSLLKDMANDGLIEAPRARSLTPAGGLPKVCVLRVVDHDGHSIFAIPEHWQGDGPPPRVRVIEQGRRGALGMGERILARIEERGNGYAAHIMRRLQAVKEALIGVIAEEIGPSGRPIMLLKPVDRRQKRDWLVKEAGEGAVGDLVLAEMAGRHGVRVTERLGDPFAPRALSLIAIHKYGIPHHFAEAVTAEAEDASRLSIADATREDLTHLPIVAIDPVDARDHDDAIWAAADDDASNPGGWRAIIAIADVSHYVRPGGALDREAARRGNSVYFPDQVVPMLPHILSSGVCSLKAGEDRAAIACHLRIDAKGKLLSWRFARARVRLAANIAYERAQAAIDGAADAVDAALVEGALRPLWGCWTALKSARDAREPLDLDLPERQILLDDKGRIASVALRERLDAHRLVEDYMIAANVAAAKALEGKKAPCMYRVHEVPAREKLVTLKEYLATMGQSFALGQVVRPAIFNALIARVDDADERRRVMEQVLRSQTQAYYSPVNAGHFGLALGSYAHFTSPIRRYADLIVHRSLVGAYALDSDKPNVAKIAPTTRLSDEDAAGMARLGERISAAERRAMEAERETLDRYVAAYLSEHVGDILPVRVTGVQNFGLFATIEGLGGDAFVPLSMLGSEFFHYDEAGQSLRGSDSGDIFRSGQMLDLRLVEANPLTGSVMMAHPDADGDGGGRVSGKSRGRPMRGRPMQGKRGRPKNIRHQGRRR